MRSGFGRVTDWGKGSMVCMGYSRTLHNAVVTTVLLLFVATIILTRNPEASHKNTAYTSNQYIDKEISVSRSHNGGYEEFCLLGCNAV
jgi:hypothetical protein